MRIAHRAIFGQKEDGTFWWFAALHAPNGNRPSTAQGCCPSYHQAWVQVRRQTRAYGGNRQINVVRLSPDARPVTSVTFVPAQIVIVEPMRIEVRS